MNKEKLEKLKKEMIIASTGSSMRLSGSKVTNEEVREIIEKLENIKGNKKKTPQGVLK